MLTCMAIPPVTLVVGEEEFLVDRAVRQALAQARAALAAEAGGGDGGGDLHDLEASALGAGEINALTSPSLFGGGSTVIVRNAQNVGQGDRRRADEVRRPPGARRGGDPHPRGRRQGQGARHRPHQGRRATIELPQADPGERADRLRAAGVPAGRPAGRRGRGPRAARRDRRRPARARQRGRPARQRHRRADRQRRGGQVLPRPGRGDRLQRGRPRGRGPAERGPRAAPLGPRHRDRAGPDHQRAGDRGTAARPGRRGPPGRERQRARGRGRRPAVEDRPGPPAAARLAPGRRRPRAAGRGRGGRAGQGRRRQPRVRPRARHQADRRLPRSAPPAEPGQRCAGHANAPDAQASGAVQKTANLRPTGARRASWRSPTCGSRPGSCG